VHGNQLELGVYIYTTKSAKKGNDPDEKNRPKNKLWRTVLAWDLRAADVALALKNKFSLWSAVFDLHSDPAKSKTEIADMSEDDRKEYEEKKAEGERTLNSLELRRLDADLSIRNDRPIPLTISSEGVSGSLMLSKNALMNLRVNGGVPAVSPPPQRGGTNPGALKFGLDSFGLDSINLTLYDIAPKAKPTDPSVLTGMSGLKTGQIKVDGLKDGSLTFDNLFTPRRLTGTITKAHAENISWTSY